MREPLLALSPLPSVDLEYPQAPTDGIAVAAPQACAANFKRSERCREHYSALRAAKAGELVGCPYGFASVVVELPNGKLALTAFVPSPRLGGQLERQQAKRNPQHRFSTDAIARSAAAIRIANSHFEGVEKDILKRYSVALHEIRKMNGVVKSSAERMARREKPEDPDAASSEVVQIWKTSELMSKQFDVLEILANETLASLPLNTASDVYRMFDKCARIYRARPGAGKIALVAGAGFQARVRACDKTFAIIPTVLIENAVKYAASGSEIRVEFSVEKGDSVTRVINMVNSTEPLTRHIFSKGVRGTSRGEGSGNGLYVAQLVARQHGGEITVESAQASLQQQRCTFTIRLPVVA